MTIERPTTADGLLGDDAGLAALRAGVDRAAGHLISRQSAAGWWKGELATNVTMDAEDIFLRHFLDVVDPAGQERSARWIRSQQRPDGTWGDFPGAPPTLSTTVEAWAALRVAGDPADAEHMEWAARWIRANGGLERARVFTHIWFSLIGMWSWDRCPTLPPEMMFLPSWAPLNIYDWACWARQTIVPLTIVSAKRPVRPVEVDPTPILAGTTPDRFDPPWSLAGVFQRLDVGVRLFGKLPVNPLRRLAMRQAAEWILARQEADGGWGGIQPPWVYSILALNQMGYGLDHPAVAKALAGLDDFFVEVPDGPEGPMRWLEACQSPVWDTGLSLEALLECGVPADHPAVLRAADWLLGEQVTADGDWQVRRPGLPSAGWSFEFANDIYPDTDDSAEMVIALRKVAHPAPERLRAALDRAVAWTAGMQTRDGGWGAFDADNTRTLPTKLPFCDFGNVVDPPSADVTAHVVEMLAEEGLADSAEAQDGVRWLLEHQEDDGSWFGRWGANHLYGTGAAVPALVAAGVSPQHPSLRAAVAWLERHQNRDGGWGEDLRSYRDKTWVGRGASTPSQTGWALIALIAAAPDSPAVARGIDHLLATQRADGGWDEDLYTGTGFPGFFYIGYQMYRQVFPMWALGRYAARRGLLEIPTGARTGRVAGAPPPDGVDRGPA
ncbi:MAG: squalene--hopene cyclase [Nocardioides sp.]|uniref:squalene--hopene cyclase n=1 Tax=Nocardioides sp. TaxID=35761 RepID=UPI0039E5228A